MKAQLHFRNSDSGRIGLQLNLGIAFILLLGLSMLATAAMARGSELNLTTWDKGTFEVEFDHQYFFADNSFNLNNLQPGSYRLKVTRQQHNPYGYGGGKVSILYDGFIDIPSQSCVDAQVHRGNQLKVMRVTHLANAYTACSNPYSDPYHNNHNNNHNNNHHNNGNNGYGSCGGGMGYAAPACMCHSDFQRIIRQIRDACFESDKLVIARQALRNQWVSSDQVRQIMKQFSFESTKLEFAKFAFHRVVDPDRYYVVNSEFCFSSSIRELDLYINGCH